MASAQFFGNVGRGWKLSLVIVAVIVTTYSVMGGMWSAAITDFVQVALIIVGMFIAIPFSLNFVGGWIMSSTTYPRSVGLILALEDGKRSLL